MLAGASYAGEARGSRGTGAPGGRRARKKRSRGCRSGLSPNDSGADSSVPTANEEKSHAVPTSDLWKRGGPGERDEGGHGDDVRAVPRFISVDHTERQHAGWRSA